MFETEKYIYRRNRRKWIYIQAGVIAIITLLAAFMLQSFLDQKRSEKVYCREEGQVNYTVALSDNDFFAEDRLDGGRSYVGALIENIAADFRYDLDIDDKSVGGRYFYRIDAILEIKDKVTDTSVLERSYPLAAASYGEIDGGKLSLKRSVDIDYRKYNDIAREFVSRYSLTDTDNLLRIKMSVNISELEEDIIMQDAKAYDIELCIPLTEATVRPTSVVASDPAEPRLLYNDNGKSGILLILLVMLVLFDALAISALIAFAVFSSDESEDHQRQVRRLLSNYKNYIQRTRSRFNAKDHQILYIDSFEEMLEIRDTVQMPILMYEDTNKRCTSFFITTASKVMYLFEIKADVKEQGTYYNESSDAEPKTTLPHWHYDDPESSYKRGAARLVQTIKKKIKDMLNG